MKCGLDLLRGSAFLIDCQDALLKINAGFDAAKHIVRRTKHAIEEAEFLAEQFEDASIGLVTLVKEVNHDDVVLLPVAMTTADPLLDPLRVPRQVVVDDQRAELKVHAFRCGFSREQDRRIIPKMLDQGGAHVNGA